MKIFVLTDIQAKPETDFSYLRRYGQYVVEKKPEVIVCIGDFADMESLSSFDKGKKAFEGRRYTKDIQAAKEAMDAFLGPMREYNAIKKKNKEKGYKPRMVLTLGNHEDRINRAVNEDAKLDGLISVVDLGYEAAGWEVHPFLEVVEIEGVAFAHYFCTGAMGRPASTATAQLNKLHQSCVAGHQQGLQMVCVPRQRGGLYWSIIAGSGYQHWESYLGHQSNKHWRGCIMLNDVRDGTFDPMPLSLDYINRKYREKENVGTA